MKELLSPMQIMEMMVDILNQKYPEHDKKAAGVIQFQLRHKGENINCFIESDTEKLVFKEGIAVNSNVIVKSTFYNWLNLAGGRLNPVVGVLTGKLKFKGDTSFFDVLPKKTFNNGHLVPEDPVTKFEKKPSKYWEKPGKVIILNASPRKNNGYTDFYLRPFVKGMEKNAKVEVICLNDYKIKPCTGCFHCWMNKPGECTYHHHDDYHKLAEKMFTANLIVYAFPIYADGMPGILKNYFDRSVSRAYPYMIEGMKRVRHPRRYIHQYQTMVVFSICGFYEMLNFKPVKTYFKALAHNRHCPVVGEIYRTCAVGLHGNPFYFKKLTNVIEALEKAGEEIINLGKIKRKTNRCIRQKISRTKNDLLKVNEWWIDRKGSGDNNY